MITCKNVFARLFGNRCAQAIVEANQKFCGISHRIGLFDGKDLRRLEAGSTDRDDERLSQLSDHVAGEYWISAVIGRL